MNNRYYTDLMEVINRDLNSKLDRLLDSLFALKAIVDAYYDMRIKVTMNNDDFNASNHVYNLDVIMGMISNNVYAGLELNVPARKSVYSKI